MATIARASTRRRPIAVRLSLRLPLWAAVVCSRLLIVAAGGLGVLSSRVPGWTQFDAPRVSTGLGSVGNVLAATAVRWDSIRYVEIAQHGYTSASQTVSYPFYSVLIRLLSLVIGSPVLCGVIISLCAFAAALLMIHRLTTEELGGRAADITVALIAFAPLSFFFSAVYTESLLLALIVGSFYLARQERFVWAGVCAGCAALTHVEGVLLAAPLILMYWRTGRRPWQSRRSLVQAAVPALLPGLALAGFFVYLHLRGYGWLAPISSANKANYGRSMVGPPAMLWQAFNAAIGGMEQVMLGVPLFHPGIGGPFTIGFQNLVYFFVLLISLLTLAGSWCWLPREYAVFATLALIVCTSTVVTGAPLEGYDRYMLVVFPLWMCAGAWLQRRRLMLPLVLVTSAGALAFYSLEFARWVFIA